MLSLKLNSKNEIRQRNKGRRQAKKKESKNNKWVRNTKVPKVGIVWVNFEKKNIF